MVRGNRQVEVLKTDWRDVGWAPLQTIGLLNRNLSACLTALVSIFFFGGGTDNYLPPLKYGMAARLQAARHPNLSRSHNRSTGIPLYDPEYQWYGAALSNFGIMYNEELRELLKLPKATAWQDLGKLGIAR